MRISDWSSDVCSSDLLDEEELIEESGDEAAEAEIADTPLAAALTQIKLADRSFDKDEFLGGGRVAFVMIVADYAAGAATSHIGRAPCRGRGCKSGWMWVVAVYLKKHTYYATHVHIYP